MVAFVSPAGLATPHGVRAPQPTVAPWPLAGRPAQAGRPSARDRRAVARALSRVRLVPGGQPARICLAEDLSGSMSSVAAAREAVVQGLLDWCGRQLPAGSELALISFGGDACVRLAPAPVDEPLTLRDAALSSSATMLGPTWSLVRGFPATELPTAAVLISDGLVSDLSGPGGRVGADGAGVSRVALVLPEAGAYAAQVPRCWTAAFPGHPTYLVDATDVGVLARVLATVLADCTGQEVVELGAGSISSP